VVREDEGRDIFQALNGSLAFHLDNGCYNNTYPTLVDRSKEGDVFFSFFPGTISYKAAAEPFIPLSPFARYSTGI